MPIRFPVEPEVTMETVLRLPALRRGAPELLAGAERLGVPVRWGHSCEARHVTGLLEGGELLLMTGMGLRTSAADQRAFVRELVEHEVAGLVIELGPVFRSLPEPLVGEARRLRLPLAALHQEVRFVEVTEQLHTALLGRRTVAESRVAELSSQLMGALLDGAGVEAVLDRLAVAVGNPVVLERVSGELVFHAAHRSSADDLLAHLRMLREGSTGASAVDTGGSRGGGGAPAAGASRGAGGALAAGGPRGAVRGLAETPAGLAAADVAGPGGDVWGRLVVVPHERPVDGLSRLAVERIAPLVALALRRAGEEALLRSRERGNVLHDVVTGAVGPADAAARAAELGLEARGRPLLPLAAAWRSATGEETRLETLRAVRTRLRSRGMTALVGTRATEDDVLVVLALPAGTTRADAADALAEVLGGATGGQREPAPGGEADPRAPADGSQAAAVTRASAGRSQAAAVASASAGRSQAAAVASASAGGSQVASVAVGPVAADWGTLPAALRAAADTAATMRDAASAGWHDATEPDVARLLWGLRGNPLVSGFARQRLGPVLEHDRERHATLLPTLEALSGCHWHKARAARALGIQRQSLYARVERLEALLDADLDDPAVRLGLDLAVRALVTRAAPGPGTRART